MPQNYKTSINNLIIVWQGSNWSVIVPDGTVIFRSFVKENASDFARSYKDYVGNKFTPYSSSLVSIEEKPKRNDWNTAVKLSLVPQFKKWAVRFVFGLFEDLLSPIIWLFKQVVTFLQIAGLSVGVFIGSCAAIVAGISGACKLLFSGWPFEMQVFLNSMIVMVIAYLIGVICYRALHAKENSA